MITITLKPSGRQVPVAPGTCLLDALRQAGCEIAALCNGRQLCGKCKVRIAGAAPPVSLPHPHLTAADVAGGIRLACEVAIREPMAVTLLSDHGPGLRILEGGPAHRIFGAPAAQIRVAAGKRRLCYRGRAPVAMTGWPLAFSPRGLAIDLGTTTLVATLMDLQTGAALATASAVNPQTRFGHDVITRIQAGSTPEGLHTLAACLCDTLNALVSKLCRDSAASAQEIIDAVMGGNTAMLQIAAGIDPAPLGRLPFSVGIEGGKSLPAGRFALAVHPQARVYLPPVVHAFVGADISAGLLDVDFFAERAPALFIDLGTNGEMALIADGRVTATSTAAGPAFEGMGITHGMVAAAGAIESAWTEKGRLKLGTIDGAPARGICGSGIVDLMACLLHLGAVDSAGRLTPPSPAGAATGPLPGCWTVVDRVTAIRLSQTVVFTQKDIRQFQLASGAVRTGIEMLLEAAGVAPARLEKIVIGGAFGVHLRKQSLRRVGIVPPGFAGAVVFAGNTCLGGCARMLMDAGSRQRIEGEMARVSCLDIAGAPGFQDRFIENLAFPKCPPRTSRHR